jgi:hypothetical protein
MWALRKNLGGKLGESRALRRAVALLPFGFVASMLAYAADGGSYTIQPRTDAASWSLDIDGRWPTQCPPSLKSVTLDGTDLRIDARSDLTLCDRTAMPFSIELNPALAVDKTSLDPGIYHVSFYAADGANDAPKLRAFTLVDRSASDAPPVSPEPGFWFTANTPDATTNRTILSVEPQDGQLNVALMSYDDLGQPTWFFGAAPFNGHIAHVPLVHIVGGTDAFHPSITPTRGDALLALDLQFQSGAHALGWVSRERGNSDDSSLQVQPLDLVRLPMTNTTDGQAWQGDWVLVADDDNAPQKLHLTQYRAVDAQHFEISDVNVQFTLACTREPTQPDWPPSSCSLRRGNDVVSGAFDSVALSRMDGLDGNGAAIHLLRVSR